MFLYRLYNIRMNLIPFCALLSMQHRQSFSFLGVQIICRMGILGDDHFIVFPSFGYGNDFFTAASHSLLPSAPVMNSFCASVITNTFFVMFPLLYSFFYNDVGVKSPRL